ncbi:DUF2157 domain-containing protein [Campylobacter geochelonis]|uniref:DUF2157 domain-containing protein n=1 Tax=Campylobacter geochelonis TaxID=1780362 RepID=UPI00077086F7|nr:DUF2157 domain-containing protein [Campylobacter geochelonis]CZE48130.1 Predicted membrane protein (DUF2157) [Campylobacter geochelonis]CZE51105.1 Predicted membrane protein (DUF2157) [Campylobacter geochelonis]
MSIFFKEKLKDELIKWQNSGIVDKNTAQNIAKFYDMNLNAKGSNLALNLIAYSFLALSLIVLIGANWEEIPRFIRVVMLVGLTLSVHIAGFTKLENYSTSTALFFLGNLCFASSIILIAQIYSIGEYMSDGVLWMAIGSLALSLALLNPILMTQTLIFAGVWFVVETFLGNFQPFFIVFLLCGVYALCKKSSLVLLAWTLAWFYLFGVGYFLTLPEPIFSSYTANEIIYYTFFSLLVIYGASLVVGKFSKDYASFMVKFTLFFGSIFLMIATAVNAESLDDIYTKSSYVYLVVLAVLTVGAIIYKKFAFLLFMAVFAIFITLDLGGIYFKVTTSFLLFGLGFFMSKNGLVYGRSWEFRFGVFTLFMLALIRYIDLVGDYIGASLLFLVFAVVILFLSKKIEERKNV